MVGLERSAKNTDSKGTTMKKSSQIPSMEASAPAIPGQVGVAMTEIAENVQEGLLALTVGAGRQVMQALVQESWPLKLRLVKVDAQSKL